MKTHSILALCITIALASCQKSAVKPNESLNTLSSQGVTGKKSNFDLLTAHNWLYVKYYNNYVDSTNPGQLVYKRGRYNNKLNLDLNRVKFNTDGTVNEIDQNGNSVPGTWHFTNSAQTDIAVTNNYGIFYSHIDTLTATQFIWTDHNSHNHAVMLGVNYYFLTAHTWEYVKYYTNYVNSTDTGVLVYQRGSSSNIINLDQNRVTFNKNGTVDEIDQNGNYVPGTWRFLNAQQTAYQVTNVYGAQANTIINLVSSTRFTWTAPTVGVHAVMKPAN